LVVRNGFSVEARVLAATTTAKAGLEGWSHLHFDYTNNIECGKRKAVSQNELKDIAKLP
jgi:hypothetical protein